MLCDVVLALVLPQKESVNKNAATEAYLNHKYCRLSLDHDIWGVSHMAKNYNAFLLPVLDARGERS